MTWRYRCGWRRGGDGSGVVEGGLVDGLKSGRIGCCSSNIVPTIEVVLKTPGSVLLGAIRLEAITSRLEAIECIYSRLSLVLESVRLCSLRVHPEGVKGIHHGPPGEDV